MNGRICLVTGSTHGIGLVTARALAVMGATVVVHSRDLTRAQTRCAERSGAKRCRRGAAVDGERTAHGARCMSRAFVAIEACFRELERAASPFREARR